MAGTASSLLGLARFGLGALTAPLVGLGGHATDAIPLGIVITACALLGIAAYAAFLRPRAMTSAPTAADRSPALATMTT